MRLTLHEARDVRIVCALLALGVDVRTKQYNVYWCVALHGTALDHAFNLHKREVAHCLLDVGAVAHYLNKSGYKFRKVVLRARRTCARATLVFLAIFRGRMPRDMVREMAFAIWRTRADVDWERV